MAKTFSQYLCEEQFFPSTLEELHHELTQMQLMGSGFALHELSINPDLTVSWNGNLDLAKNQYIKSIGRIPVKFKTVIGTFDCSDNNLTTLEGCPANCGGFRANDNLFESLKGGPARVRGNYSIENNPYLLSFDDVAYYIVGNLFSAGCYGLTSLHDIHKKIQTLHGTITLSTTQVYRSKSSLTDVLGLLLINGLKRVDPTPLKGIRGENKYWNVIVNKFLPNGDGKNGVIECQNALLDAGFDKAASL